MTELAELGISANEAELILEDEFPVGKYLKKKQHGEHKARLLTLVETADAVRMGTLGATSKQGLDAYSRWRRNMIEKMNEKPVDEMTVFEKLKRARGPETLFEKMKRRKKIGV